MTYQYNYSFLSEWMKANKKISLGSILQAIGTKSNNSLHMWEQGMCAMPVIGLLRFCNTFKVPISAFICNTGEPCENDVMPSDDAQFEPDGGYTTDTTTRQPGERRPLNPTDVTPTPSNVPNAVPIEKYTSQKNVFCGNNAEGGNNMELSSLLELQTKQVENSAGHLAQQQKLLDVIMKQQEQIEKLTQLLQDRKDRNKGYSMVAET